ncbi:hypothetical protein RB195_025495 [Necator americanus]|uniref:Uncharacterized protein n=1 Tax=Necator americanus TaxID=51031 RepID=A0ABR1ESI7_NECAM
MPIANEVNLQVYLSAIRPIMIYGSETPADPSSVTEKHDYMEKKLLRRMLGYFCSMVYHNNEPYSEVHMKIQQYVDILYLCSECVNDVGRDASRASNDSKRFKRFVIQ